MDGKTLTGRDAAEALSLCMRLGAADARFDGRKVMQAIRSSAGRRRVEGAILLARFVRPLVRPLGSRPRTSRRAARHVRVAAATVSPGRPGRPEEAV